MSAQITEFQFKNSSNPWRLDWLGHLTYPGSGQSEPTIAAYLSELDPGYTKLLSNGALAPSRRHEVVHIKVGQIALLNHGSVWLDGVRQAPHVGVAQKVFTVQHGQLDLIRFDQPIEIDGESAPLLTAHRYRLGLKATKELASSWIAVVFNPAPDVKFLAIPAPVMFQKCLATSPKAIRRLIYGEIDKIIDPVIESVADEPETLCVTLFRDFCDREAKAMVNVKVDPVGKAAFKILRTELVAASVNASSQDLGTPQTHIKFGLPFSNPVRLTVRGKSLPIESSSRDGKTTEYGFLVTEIVGLQTQLVFDKLVIERKNDARKGQNAQDPNLQPYGPIPIPGPADFDEPNQPLTSEVDPSDKLEVQALEAGGDFDATNLVVIKDEKEVQNYKAVKRVRIEDEDFEGTGTTGDPGSNGQGTAPVDIKPQQTPSVPITLDHFFDALAVLAKRGIYFETIAVSTSHRKRNDGHHTVNFLPVSIKKVRSWHLMPKDNPTYPRGYVVARLFRGLIWHYLIEVEHKTAGEMALLHLRSVDGQQIEPRLLQWFMVDVAVANGWSGAMEVRRNRWKFKPVRHSHQKSGAIAFAKAIEKVL